MWCVIPVNKERTEQVEGGTKQTAKQRETTREKGRRLYDAGCVAQVGAERWEVEGSGGKYSVERRGTFLYCSCPSCKADCSYVEAEHCAIASEMAARVEESKAEVDEGSDSWEWRAGETEEKNARRYAAYVEAHGTIDGTPWDVGDPVPMF